MVNPFLKKKHQRNKIGKRFQKIKNWKILQSKRRIKEENNRKQIVKKMIN